MQARALACFLCSPYSESTCKRWLYKPSFSLRYSFSYQMNDITKTSVTKAEGFFELGMHEDAWAILDNLDSLDQQLPSVLGLRARILIGTESWVKAEILASSIVTHMPHFGLAWYTLAQAYAQQGKLAPAKEALTRACEVDEKFKIQAIVDELLTQVW